MLPKTDEVFLTWAAVFPQTSKGPANMDCWEWEKFVFYLVLESSGISSYVTGIMVHHNYSQSMLSVAVKKAVCLVLLCRA